MKSKYLYTFLICFISFYSNAQFDYRIDKIETELEYFSSTYKNLNRKIDISNLDSIQTIIVAIAQQIKINVDIDTRIHRPVKHNFKKVRAKDIFIYLCQRYHLDLKFTGSIIRVTPYFIISQRSRLKEVGIYYNKYNATLSLDLNDDTLSNVVKEIIKQSGVNIILSPTIQKIKINVFADKMAIHKALQILALSNHLHLTQPLANTFFLSQESEFPEKKSPQKKDKNHLTFLSPQSCDSLYISTKLDSNNHQKLIDIQSINTPFKEIIKQVSLHVGKDYFFFNNQDSSQNLDFPISLKLVRVTYNEFLNYILKGTALTYKLENDIYLIGNRNMEGLRATKRIQLQYRSAEDIENIIPQELLDKVTIHSFLELNSLILSGSVPNIREVERFIRDIDKVVPVIMIELIIMDVNRDQITDTGLKIGIGDKPVEDERLGLGPGIDFQLGANSINQLLTSLSGAGFVNLGRVLPNFYFSLKLIEEQGFVKTHSRPQLSTLNSHKATFNIGETRYYAESQTTIYDDITQQNVTYKSVEANFIINVTPFVSGNEQITLKIDVQQSNFLENRQIVAPSAQSTRKFDSKIRVKNGEMIALGGLENRENSNYRKGLPSTKNVPVLNFLGEQQKVNNNSELVIFIKPTIVY